MLNILKRFIIDEPTGGIKGSFINLCITVGVGSLIAIGAFRADVADNLKTMETLIIGFFTASFGIWAGKKVFEMKTETNERVAGVERNTKERAVNADRVAKGKGGQCGSIEKMPDGID